MPARLGVNVDHVATLRQSRRTQYPDPVAAAMLAELGGADQITIHLREDRRHVQERDLHVMRRTVSTRLNLEMAATQEMVKIAYETKPDVVTLVPERREELTTEGGLDVVSGRDAIRRVVKTLRDAEIKVSLFIDPDLDQVRRRTGRRRRRSSSTPGATATRGSRRTAAASCRGSSTPARRPRSSGSRSRPGTGSTTRTWGRSRRSPRSRS
jgi:hypothetical protein